MVAFQYEAFHITNRRKESGLINASTEREARERLRELDLIPTQICHASTRLGENGAVPPTIFERWIQQLKGITLKEKIVFSRNLGMMTKSGIPLSEGLLYLENYARNVSFKSILSQIRSDILAGSSFSQALAQHPHVFNRVFVNVIQAGEVSGELVRSLARLTDLLTKTQKLQVKVMTASVYPLIVLTIVGIVLIIMTFLVLPTFQDIYHRMGVDLPWITQWMMSGSDYFRTHWHFILPLILLSGLLGYRFIRTLEGRQWLDAHLIRLPVIGELVQLVNNSHFISTFNVSFGAGLPITDALHLASETVQNLPMKCRFEQVNLQIQTGERLAIALAQTGQLPEIVLLMISSGEESGQLDEMLQNCYDYVEEEINYRIDILTTMMEPVMLVVLGMIVGVLALAIYLPMFRLYESL